MSLSSTPVSERMWTNESTKSLALEPRSRPLEAMNWCAVALVMIVVGRAHEILPGLVSSLPLVKVVVAVAAFLLLTKRRALVGLKPLSGSHGRYMLVYLAAMFLSVPFSIYLSASAKLLWKTFVPNLAILLILIAASNRPATLDVYFRSLVISVILLGGGMLAGLGQSLADVTGVRYSISAMYDPNDLALVAAISVPFSLYLWRDRELFWRLVGLLGLACAIVIVIRTGSRGGLLALFAALLPALIGPKSILTPKVRVAILACLSLAVPFLPETFLNRASSIFSLESDYNVTASDGRVAIFKRGMGHFARRPLTGVGFGQFHTAEGAWAESRGLGGGFKWSAAHNMYLQAAAELGIFGVIGLFGLLFRNLALARAAHAQMLRKQIDHVQWMRGVTIRDSTLALAVGGTFLSVAYSPIFIFIFALGIGYAGQLQRSKNSRLSFAAPAWRHPASYA